MREQGGEQLKEPTNVIIFDTTLRDGVQSPDASANKENALYIAESLAEAGTDVIEAGFPGSSRGNFATVRNIADKVNGPIIAAFARTLPEDIEQAGRALEPAGDRARINVCAPVSDLHIKERLGMGRKSLLELAVKSTKQAKEHTHDVEFSFEDSTRADLEFLKKTVLAVANTGATTMMLPDTVGAMLPREYSERLLAVREELDSQGFKDVVIAAHCHNDLGQSVMNSVDALRFGGAEQVEVTIGGVGERNGNTPLELVVGNIAVQPELGLRTNVDPLKLRNLTHSVAPRALGVRVAETQPFIGRKSYVHGSGMHQDGVIKDEGTFKNFPSSTFGFDKPFEFKINDQSGKAGVRYELSRLNVNVGDDELLRVTEAVKDLSTNEDRNLGHNDLEKLASGVTGEKMEDKFNLETFSFSGDTEGICEATLTINGQKKTVKSEGGVVDAAKQVMQFIVGFEFDIGGWHVDDLEEGSDAAVRIFATVKHNGYEIDTHAKSKVSERAGVEALMHAVNVIDRAEERVQKAEAKKAA